MWAIFLSYRKLLEYVKYTLAYFVESINNERKNYSCNGHLSLPGMGSVTSGKFSPVSPGEDDVGRSAEDLQKFPRESVGESPSENAVSGLEVVIKTTYEIYHRSATFVVGS